MQGWASAAPALQQGSSFYWKILENDLEERKRASKVSEHAAVSDLKIIPNSLRHKDKELPPAKGAQSL